MRSRAPAAVVVVLAAAAGLAASAAGASAPEVVFDLQPARIGDPFLVHAVRVDGAGDRVVAAGSEARPSPDGRLIAVRRARGALWVVARDGGHEREIADAARAVVWRRDSRALAFSSLQAPGVWIARPDGRSRRLVYRGFADPVGFAVDGRRLVLIRQDFHHRFRLRMLDLRSGAVRSLRAKYPFPAVSPNGRELAFVAADGLWVVDLVTLRRRRVASGAVVHGTQPWSPDGRRLAVELGIPPSVGVVDVAAGRAVRVTRGRGFGDLRPSWSPDARWIAFAHNGTDLRVVRPDGSGARTLARAIVGFALAWLS